jgi:molecular chaperone DnaJ
MDLKTACQILGIDPGASQEEVKKAFKKKAAEFHPDKNKSENAEIEFKKLNEANQFFNKFGNQTHQVNKGFNYYTDFDEVMRIRMQEIFGTRVNIRKPSHIQTKIQITFEECVQGTSKTIEYKRMILCTQCKEKEKCEVCGGNGYVYKNQKATLKIPPGVENNKVLRVSKGGDVKEGSVGDLLVNIIIEPSDKFKLQGKDVISNLEITLLEALKGTKKKVQTVKGEKTLIIPALVKNKDTIRVPKYGVPPNGDHVINLKVNYPDDVQEIIQILEKED